MSARVNLTETDVRTYEQVLKKFLPDRIIDIHSHVWLDELKGGRDQFEERVVSWPELVAGENSIEDHIALYAQLFPGKKVTPLIFSGLADPPHLEALNRYVGESASAFDCPSLLFALPEWSGDELAAKVSEGRFLGIKVYLSLAPSYIPGNEIRIFDYLPHHQLEVIDRNRWIAMLHIPRSGRLADPVNLAQLLEIDRRYPNARVIVAHVGRAYCPENAGTAFDILKDTTHLFFDISANTDSWVFERLIETVGPKRILFGSDLPITRMRMRRICENGMYVNIVPKGMYGDMSGDPHMRETDRGEDLTFFIYEEIEAFRKAAGARNLTEGDVEDVFYGNARRIFDSSGPRPAQLHMVFPEDKLERVSPPDIPAGYRLRTFREGDEQAYIQLMRRCGFEGWDAFASVLQMALPEGLFFIVHEASGEIVATAVSNHRPKSMHPSGGELGWVAVDPDHRGKGLGRAVCSAVLRRMNRAGYSRVYLSTDDHRLAALKVYLKLGFVPFPVADDQEQRWRAVFNKAGAPPSD